MAPRSSRRRRDAEEPPEDGGPDANVDLDAPEHAWWAQQDISAPWVPAVPPTPPPEDEPERDPLADHLGVDWRTTFGLDSVDDIRLPPETESELPREPTLEPEPEAEPEPEPEPEAEPEPEPILDMDIDIDTSDPYAVLGVEPSATWEAIVAAHRRQARRHHPDGLFGRSEAEIVMSEKRMRDINLAFGELKVRRGK